MKAEGVIAQVAAALNGSMELGEALDVTLQKVAELLGLETGWIWLLDAEGRFYLAASRMLPEGFEANPSWTRGWCRCQQLFRDGKLEEGRNFDPISCTRLAGLSEGSGGFEYHASVPIVAEGERLGILNLASEDWRELREDELTVLRAVSAMLAIAVQRTRLFMRSQELGAIEERTRVAREIHDTVAQKLVALTMQLEALDARLEDAAERDEARHALRRAMELARSSLDDTRRAVGDLRGASIAPASLEHKLRRLVEDVRERSKLDVSLDWTKRGPDPDPGLATAIYRLCQEGLANAEQHSDARRATIGVTVAPEAVYLTIGDDGSGFEPAGIEADSFGLMGMAERVRLLDGELTIATELGQGTEVSVTLPRRSAEGT